MNKLDQLIEEALRDQDRAILEATEEQGWFALGLDQFRGKLGWITWIIVLVQTTLFFVGIWCAYHFFNAVEVQAILKWGFSGTVAILMSLQLKLSLMPQMQADRILRELKRVELLLIKHQSERR